jgi:hypothetical protein
MKHFTNQLKRAKKCISIDIQWIPRSENTKADYISKILDHEDW